MIQIISGVQYVASPFSKQTGKKSPAKNNLAEYFVFMQDLITHNNKLNEIFDFSGALNPLAIKHI